MLLQIIGHITRNHHWENRILAIDPGFRVKGCKIVCLDEKAIYYTTKPFISTAEQAQWR
jgi:hypothetical protein